MSQPVHILTPEDLERSLAPLRQRVAQQEAEAARDREFMRQFLASIDDQVSTQKALEISGIKSRTTLIAERQRPGSPLTYTSSGRSVSYSRAGCIAYKLSHQLAA